MKSFIGKLFSVFFLLVAACEPTSTQPTKLTSITVQLGSTHQAIYAGFYAASQNGDYAREGLDVTFLEGAPTIDVVLPIVDGTAQFSSIGATSVVSARGKGQSVRALATILRRDPVVFFSLADSGIVNLEGFMGKKVLVSLRLRPRLYAMLAHAGMNPDEIIEVNTGDFSALYSGEIDVASGLITTSMLSVEQAGYEVNLIYPDDYGVHFYSSTIAATDDFIAANPELVTGFLRATMEGWSYVVENPQSVGQLVSHYKPGANNDFEVASMVASLPYINTGEDHIGWMRHDIWEGMIETMYEQGELTLPLDAKDVYTMEFIQQIYMDNNT